MSDIPKAREILQELVSDPNVDPRVKRQIGRALGHMLRVKACRRAPEKPQRIDAAMRRRVRKLAEDINLTTTDIAAAVGLRNCGRVSEILHGKR